MTHQEAIITGLCYIILDWKSKCIFSSLMFYIVYWEKNSLMSFTCFRICVINNCHMYSKNYKSEDLWSSLIIYCELDCSLKHWNINSSYYFQLTVGVIGREETVFDKPPTPAEIRSVIYSTIQPYDVIQAVLQQEVVLYCGRLIATNPDMFKGILKIRVG